MRASVEQRRPILAGNLAEFSVQSLMSAFSLGRQVVTIEVLNARGVCDARIVMKAGRVLSAQAAGRTGIDAVRHLMATAAPAKFRVVRETSDEFARAPHVGTLAEVTHSASAGKPLAPVAGVPRAPARVMEGSLSDFDVATILQVVSTARQHTVMEIVDPRGNRVGSIELKAGKVLRAEAGSLRGVPAVQQLLHAPSSFRFSVQRARDPVGELPLLGAVDEVLMRAASAEPPPNARRSDVYLAAVPAPEEPGLDPDEIETLIPVSAPYPAGLDEIEEALEELEDELEDEVTRANIPRRAEASPPPGTALPVLDGRLSDFDLCSVLQVAGLSRQPTSVRIFDEEREPVGEVRVQGGQLLAVSAQGERDHAALRLLLHCPRDFYFSVWRQPNPPAWNEAPLGPVSELLERATERPLALSPEPLPAFRPQAPSLPVGAPASSRTSPRALAAGLLLGVAAGVIVTIGLSRDDNSAAPQASTGPRALQAQSGSAQPPAASAAPSPAISSTQPAARPPSSPAPRIDAEQLPPSPRVEPIPSAAPLFRPLADRSRAEVASIQGALRMLGFGPGPIDGFPGRITRTAIGSFQRAEGLPEDGELSPDTEQRLLARIRGSQRDAN